MGLKSQFSDSCTIQPYTRYRDILNRTVSFRENEVKSQSFTRTINQISELFLTVTTGLSPDSTGRPLPPVKDRSRHYNSSTPDGRPTEDLSAGTVLAIRRFSAPPRIPTITNAHPGPAAPQYKYISDTSSDEENEEWTSFLFTVIPPCYSTFLKILTPVLISIIIDSLLSL